MKSFRLVLLSSLFFSLAAMSGCSSTGGRQVSLQNDTVPEKVKFGEGVVSTVGRTAKSKAGEIQPISASRTDEAQPNSWSKLLSPFKAKKKRIPLPISKPDDGQSDLEVGIEDF